MVFKSNVLINCVKDEDITYKHAGTEYGLKKTCIGWISAYTDVSNHN